MAKQLINIGRTANDRSGDPLRTAFIKVNENFNELYTAVTEGVNFNQVNADWNAISGVAEILNKPNIPTDVSDLTDTNQILVQHPANKLQNGDFEVSLGIDGSLTVPASSNIRGTNDLNIVSEVEGNFTGLFLNGNPLLGSAILYANRVATIRADSGGTVKDWTFDKSGTLTTWSVGDTIGFYSFSTIGGGADLVLTVDTIVPNNTPLDLTKTINKLADGVYSLADGVEGQIIHLVPGPDTTSLTNVTVTVAHSRDGASQFTDGYLYPFSYWVGSEQMFTSICTLIFTDGHWQQTGGGWD